jgi:S-formylglutathione hydrolase FrmB
MSFATVQWFSKALGKQVQTNVILPDRGQGPFATLYLLHGLSDDYSIWARRTRLEMYVADLPLIVVMPDGYRGFYTNNNEGPDYFTYMTEDLPQFIERAFHAKPARSARCVGGLSMGGYGALRLALGRPDLYASAHSHSGALMHGSGFRSSMPNPEFDRVFGKDPAGTDHDLLALAKRALRKKMLPKLRIDCGNKDFLLQANREAHAQLTRLKVPHEYEEFPGGHSWDYWDLHVREAISFHARNLRLKRRNA